MNISPRCALLKEGGQINEIMINARMMGTLGSIQARQMSHNDVAETLIFFYAN